MFSLVCFLSLLCGSGRRGKELLTLLAAFLDFRTHFLLSLMDGLFFSYKPTCTITFRF